MCISCCSTVCTASVGNKDTLLSSCCVIEKSWRDKYRSSSVSVLYVCRTQTLGFCFLPSDQALEPDFFFSSQDGLSSTQNGHCLRITEWRKKQFHNSAVEPQSSGCKPRGHVSTTTGSVPISRYYFLKNFRGPS